MNENHTIRDLTEAAQQSANTFATVYLSILRQSAERTAAAADLAQLAARLEAQRERLALVAEHFAGLLAEAHKAPDLLRPLLLGQVKALAVRIVELSVEAGGQEEQIAGIVAGQIAHAFPEAQAAPDKTYKRVGRSFQPVGHTNGEAS